MRASLPSRTVVALVATVAVVIAACGAPASPTLAPGATPTASPLGGAAGRATTGPDATEATGGGPGISEEPSYEEITPSFGERNLFDVELLAGDMTWDGELGTAGSGWKDSWNIQVDLVLRRSPDHGGLVFAKGSTYSVDWESTLPVEDTDLCKERSGHWTGDIGSLNGETWDRLSEPESEGIGLVWEDLHSLRLDIRVGGIQSGDWCSFPGAILNCPYQIAPGTAAIWQQTIDDPARLDYSCTDVSPANSGMVYKVNTRGLLQEAEDVPPQE